MALAEVICFIIAKMPKKTHNFLFRLYWRLKVYWVYLEEDIQTKIFQFESRGELFPSYKRNESIEAYCHRLTVNQEYLYTKYWAQYWIRNVRLMNFLMRYAITSKKDRKKEATYLMEKQRWVNLFQNAYMRKLREGNE